jgi:hypothetical protein
MPLLRITVNEGQRLVGTLLTAMALKYCTCRIGSEKEATLAVKGKVPQWKQQLDL